MKTKKLLTVVVLGLGFTLIWLGLLSIGSPAVVRADSFTVDTADAGGPGSLRQAIISANGTPGHDEITFAPGVVGTIVLTDSLPQIVDDLTITGPGAGILAVSGANSYRVVSIAGNTAVTISGITIRDGKAPASLNAGGGIRSLGTLLLIGADVVSSTATFGGGMFVTQATLNGGQIMSNTALVNGGGVFVATGSGAFTQTGVSTITLNTADFGGGVFVDGGRAVLGGGQVVNNTADQNGGGVYITGGSATLDGGQIVSNTAAMGGGVFVLGSSAAFTLSGDGTIGYNSANYGGGLYLTGGGATLCGGQIISNTAPRGGGVCVQSGAILTLSDSTIGYNTANYGGGVYVDEGHATQSGGQIVSNAASQVAVGGHGGGVYVYEGGAAFTQTGGTIEDNSAYDGGGVYLRQGGVTLSGGGIVSNTAGNYGGGAAVINANATLDQFGPSVIAHNSAFLGGGVFVFGGSATLAGGQIAGNTAVNYGGGVYIIEGTATLRGAEVISNSAASLGGIRNGGTLTMINTTLSHNRATLGNGGGLGSYGTATVTYTTIVSNSAPSGGGGVWTSGPVLLVNTIVAHNSSPTCVTDSGGTFVSSGHNLEDTDTCGLTATTDLTDTDPLVGPLTFDQGTWIHPLLEDSPAIDGGTCLPAVTTVDQRGVTRPQGGECDIGAYERIWHTVHLPLLLRSSP